MKTSVFVSFCLVIVAGFLAMQVFFKDAMSPELLLKKRLVAAEKQRQAAEFSAQLAAADLADYQQHVATLLPEAIKIRGNDVSAYPLRQLASVAGKGSEILDIERASGLFENAKTAFRDKDYDEAAHLFSQVIDRYPTSAHVIEAHFLMAESQYQDNDLPGSVATIEKMVESFPENDLTGFALLRLGHIFEVQNRTEDAGDIYRAVLANFKQKTLTQQAERSLASVRL